MNKKLVNISALLLLSLTAAAQDRPEPPSELSNPVAIVLLTVIIGLLIAIAILGNAVISAMDIYRDRMKKSGTILTILLILVAGQAMAQDTPAIKSTLINGLSQTSFYLLVSVIAVEIIVIISLLFTLRILVGIERKKRIKPARETVPGKPKISWLDKLNDTKSLDADSEADVDMGHDYDGIHELNNPTPPWWRYGFYCSILFAVVYLWRFQSAPTQAEELASAETAAAEEKAEYLKLAANNIDEKSVKLLTDQADLAAAQKLFSTNCAPCHGPQGQGVVGPNLTDDYWLHGGKINEVFSTIKYGVADKGMKSWKDDFSPRQLAQLASYIKSIHGSNPPDPKEKQGIPEQ
ncbi:cytochrome c oxidase cbb3-type subunit 3 [Chitinophaga sp. YR573]|uniref:cbb3-type cytochrome c oxidase N-terminal domain-containing protein n=1 Tax=Chitinophaga sp. YR573 TaxID=1881040 RepID=UPI0008CEE0F4|nr:cbb3-type cytochrome c oxidase N-terminal domain-containing protein [Chitinophaga sp. YR573]SEW10702.1 cytochrome c oxidase cbb3-type subunit 3 [Chitinophaga sp. YR573]